MADDKPNEPNLPVAVETAVGMLPAAWRDKALEMAVRFVGKRFLPDLYREISQERDDARARAIISDALAHEAGRLMAKDPALVRRATERLFVEQAEKQENIEAIVLEATEQLEHSVGTDEVPPEDEISDDWRRKFTSFAEDVSEPEMRTVWARILAGEFQKPGSFSYRTLRLISEIDTEIAELFQELASRAFGRDVLLSDPNWNSGAPFEKIGSLIDAGLVLDAPDSVHKTVPFQASKLYALPGVYIVGVVEPLSGVGPEKFHLPIVRLTSAGKELFALIDEPAEEPVIIEAMEFVRKEPKVPSRGYFVKRHEPFGELDRSTVKFVWVDPAPPVPAP